MATTARLTRLENKYNAAVASKATNEAQIKTQTDIITNLTNLINADTNANNRDRPILADIPRKLKAITDEKAALTAKFTAGIRSALKNNAFTLESDDASKQFKAEMISEDGKIYIPT